MLRLLCILALLAPVLLLPAQETVNNASLSGRVTDVTGSLIVGASVKVTQVATGLNYVAATDRAGRFRFSDLSVGNYRLHITAPNFNPVDHAVTLTLGSAFDLPITLDVGTGVEVDIFDAPDILEADRTQIAGTVTEQEIQSLPSLGRNFLDLALLLPGVSPTNTGANQTFANTSAVPGQGISINSQRNLSNSFVVDGLSANDDASGLVQTSFGLDTIEEMQVVTSGGQAEFGRAIGGYVSFVTRSGTSHLHGSAYGFFRNQRLNAANALAHTALPITDAQYGASLGGPLVDRLTFYFANFEQQRLNQDGVLAISPANATAIDARLLASNYPGSLLSIAPSGSTPYPNPVKSTNLFARLDRHLSDRDDLTARYSLYRVASLNSRFTGALIDPTAGTSLADLDHSLALSNTRFFAGILNETRAQFVHSNLLAPANDPIGPAVSISGVASFGTASASPTGRLDRLYEVVDNLSRQLGPHSLRLGADFLYNDLLITFPQSIRGAYTFASLAAFQSGTYTTFTQSFGDIYVPETNPNLGLYLQDEWRARPNLTLNAGIRYDLQFLKTIATDPRNLSPRLGLAWMPYPDRHTVLRASAGLFYDRVPLNALSNALQSSGNTTNITANTFTTLLLSYGQSGAPIFPHIDSGYTALTIPANQRIGFSTIDPHLKNAAAFQASLELEQQLNAHTTFSISYQHVRGTHLIEIVNHNVPTCTAAVDPINLCRPNPAYQNDKVYSGAGDSYYNGLSVALVQRPIPWGSYRLSYNWSHAIDDVGEFLFSAPLNNYDLGEDRGRSDDDQRHRLAFDATGNLPRQFQLSGILQYYSRLPFNVVTGTNSLQTTPLRPCATGIASCFNALPGTVIGRNTGIGFAFFAVNARLSKSFALGSHLRLQALAEAFNLLNHRNDQLPNATFGTGVYPTRPAPGFGQATAVADARDLQLALRLNF